MLHHNAHQDMAEESYLARSLVAVAVVAAAGVAVEHRNDSAGVAFDGMDVHRDDHNVQEVHRPAEVAHNHDLQEEVEAASMLPRAWDMRRPAQDQMYQEALM